jgi:hypothetical protein
MLWKVGWAMIFRTRHYDERVRGPAPILGIDTLVLYRDVPAVAP